MMSERATENWVKTQSVLHLEGVRTHYKVHQSIPTQITVFGLNFCNILTGKIFQHKLSIKFL